MTRLDDYRCALRVGNAEIPDDELVRALESRGSDFASFIVDHGLGPLWHARTERAEFRASRMAAEALFTAQAHALGEIDTVLGGAGVSYVAFKGAATFAFIDSDIKYKGQEIDLEDDLGLDEFSVLPSLDLRWRFTRFGRQFLVSPPDERERVAAEVARVD